MSVSVRRGVQGVARAAIVFLAILTASLPLFSQGNTGRILGSVTDQSGGAMSGATVTVTDIQRGTTRTLTTDESGQYNAPNLTPGSYTLRAEAKGFKVTERQNLLLEVGQEVRVDLILQAGEQTQIVTVTEAVPLVETSNAELGGTLQNAVINDLPLNGRNFENLLDLRPGVTKYPGNSGWTQSTNGNRPHDNMFLVDGIDSNDPWMAQSVMNAVMAAGDAGTMLSIDAIDEFKTEENPRAEYGWKPGAVVNVGVKSGTNSIHGTGYAYGRDGDWDARNFFDTKPNPIPDVQVEQFGGSFGGPIKKDKLFYFTNFESQRYEVGNPVQHTVPITAPGVGSNTQNLIAACQAVGTKLAPLSAQLAGLSTSCAPLANYPGLFLVNNGSTTKLNTGLNSTNRVYEGLAKVDYHLGEKHTLSGMYFISPGSGTFVDAPTTEISGPWLTSQYARSQVGSGSWTWTPNSAWVNELRVGYSHYYQVFKSADATQNPANYTYNGATYHIYTGQTNPAYFGLPQITIQGGFSFVMGASWPKTVGPDGTLQLTDHVSYLRGNHAFKFGVDVLDLRSTNNVTANTKGPLRFSNLQSFFSGTPNRALFTSGNLLRHLSNQGYAAFAQDDWRITPRLTINLGLRYELNTVLNEDNNLIGNFDPTLGLVQDGHGISSVFNGDHNNFAPRLGLAWDVRGNGKTVVRAGGGVTYEQGSFDSLMAIGNLLGLRTVPTGVNIFTNGNTTPTTAGGTINVGQITFTGSQLGSPTTPGTVEYNYLNNGTNTPIFAASPACGDGTVTVPATGQKPTQCSTLGVTRNLRTPYVTTWTLDVQQAFTNNLSLDVAYVGNHATKLVGLTDLNAPPVGSGYTAACKTTGVGCAVNTAAEQAARPYNARFPYLGIISWLSNDNVANYNALQVALTQRTSHGLSFVAGYTYSHALGESPDNWRFLNPVNNNNVRSLYGNTQFDLTHRFTYSFTYAIPGRKSPGQMLEGWSINSIVNLQSAMPWGVNDATTDFSGTGEISAQNTNGEQWDFFGNPSDFKTTKALLTTNGGAGGIPCFGFGGPTASPCSATLPAACITAAKSLGPAGTTALNSLGCYATGSSVLVPPAFGTFGTLGPNAFRGMPFANWDMSITKAWKFKERLTTQFRAEFFNVLNHPNISNPFGGPGGDNTYSDPSADAGASFGFRPQTPDVTSSNPVLGSGGARAMQLGLKLIF